MSFVLVVIRRSTFKEHLETKKSFKNALANISKECPIVVLIDELDRCRPTYAIETLEVIKHYFDVPNISYVFAVDLDQLSHSVSTIYGQNMDSSGYLRKFFDVILTLPKASIKEYVRLQHFTFDKHKEGQIDVDNIQDTVIVLAEEFKLSLRDIDSLMPQILLLSKKLHGDIVRCHFNDRDIYNNITEAIFYLFFLKFKIKNQYELLLYKHFEGGARLLENSTFVKSSLPGISTLKNMLADGKNSTETNFYNKQNSDNLIGKFYVFIEGINSSERLNLGQRLHNYIENVYQMIK